MMDINWYVVKSGAFTVIRVAMSVRTLQRMADDGNTTPVSGDALVQTLEYQRKHDPRSGV